MSGSSRAQWNLIAFLLASALSLSHVEAATVLTNSCANACSGNGRCTTSDTCICFDGFTGPDCGSRLCPTASTAWGAKAPSADDGSSKSTHSQPIECSGAGTCNRLNGHCTCFSGYMGNACERVDCINQCLGRGRCVDLATAAKELGPRTVVTSLTGLTYSNWEANRLSMCICALGYSGPDCSVLSCPNGDLATTTNHQRLVVHLLSDFSSVSSAARKMRLHFAGQISGPIDVVCCKGALIDEWKHSLDLSCPTPARLSCGNLCLHHAMNHMPSNFDVADGYIYRSQMSCCNWIDYSF